VKGSIITTKTWFLLIGAALLISAGLLNFRQRVRHETPPWDGVEWVDTKGGVIARSIEHGSAAERAWMLPGDKLIGITLNPRQKAEQIGSARDVQIYLEEARTGGKIHYLMQRPSYEPDNASNREDARRSFFTSPLSVSPHSSFCSIRRLEVIATSISELLFSTTPH
jgi:hypothetical protein